MFAGTHTLVNEQRDFVDWHCGRTPYVLWALNVDVEPVRERVDAATRHLGGWLRDDYVRQPHVTLNLCGFSGRPSASPDEFDHAALLEQAQHLANAGVAPFAIRIGGLASFSSAPFLKVEDSGDIAMIRQHLGGAARDQGDGPYVPHVTVGLYAGAWSADQVFSRLSAFPAGQPIDCTIDAISLMAYDPRVIGGKLGELGRVCLKTREVQGIAEALGKIARA